MSAAKRWIKRSLAASGLLSLASRMARPGVVILAYHSVMDQPNSQADALGDIVHSTSVFRQQMEWLARHFNPISLDDAVLFVQGKKTLPGKPVVVTFDDGYADNFEVAAPVLNHLGIPATFYLTVGCTDAAAPPWVTRLRYAFAKSGTTEWTDSAGRRLRVGTRAEREQAFLAAAEHCACLAGDAQEKLVQAIERELGGETLPAKQNLMMTWDQARQLIRQGHTVGSHTMTHPNLAHVKDAALKFELEQSKQRLQEELGHPAVHFSYPRPVLEPHWTTHTVEVCRSLGYHTAVTSDSGPVRQGDDPLSLRRVPPTAGVDGLRWNLDCAFLGRAV